MGVSLIQCVSCVLCSFQVLMDDVNTGYERLAELQVTCCSHTCTHVSFSHMCVYLFDDTIFSVKNTESSFFHLQVKKVNGVEVDNLKHLCGLVEGCQDENLRFDLDEERVIVLNYKIAKLATSRILQRHRIPSAMSSDLIEEQSPEREIELSCVR